MEREPDNLVSGSYGRHALSPRLALCAHVTNFQLSHASRRVSSILVACNVVLPPVISDSTHGADMVLNRSTGIGTTYSQLWRVLPKLTTSAVGITNQVKLCQT
jgi:hypothetical protein